MVDVDGPSRNAPKRDRSAKDRNRERSGATAGDERPHRADVEGEVEREPQVVEVRETRPLELVKSPFDDGVRSRTLDLHANARSSGCRKHHGPAIGTTGPRLERRLLAVELERNAD